MFNKNHKDMKNEIIKAEDFGIEKKARKRIACRPTSNKKRA